MAEKKKRWVKFAAKKMKQGALSRQLGIPEEENIPYSLLEKVKRAEPGKVITNPTKKGKRKLTVTRVMKKRATLAITLKRAKK